MPTTQAYSVTKSATVTKTNGGTVDLTGDIVSVVIQEKENEVNQATVEVDTSQRSYALEEIWDLDVEVSDANDTKTFSGFVDEVSDHDRKPLVTIDARQDQGKLDDTSLVANISADDLFGVADAMIDTGPSKIRGVSFDAQAHRDQYGTFANATIFGNIDIAHFFNFGVSDDNLTVQETLSDRGKQAELAFDVYSNPTSFTYELTITGKDGNGDEVQATLGLPPGDSAQDAFGTSNPKIAFQGGTQRLAELTSISTDIGQPSQPVYMGGTVRNYVKTEYTYGAGDDASVRDGIETLVSYISALDRGTDWEYVFHEDVDEVELRPVQPDQPTTHVFIEGDNVIRPVANRSLDDVYNFVKVSGPDGVNAWVWAYDGSFRYSLDNPFTSGTNDYPGGITYRTSPGGGQNDIDQINLRSIALGSQQITDTFQALDIAQKALSEFYRVPVSGTAPVAGIKTVDVGDKAEIVFPSRGIPQKVVDNVYRVKQVEYRVEADEAKTEIDFNMKRPNTSDLIRSADGVPVRGDISSDLRGFMRQGSRSGGGGFRPIAGSVTSKNEDGTVTVETRDGETYTNVEVV